MDPNRLTLKSREAVSTAQSKALRAGHQQVDNEHLLLALIDESDGLAARILKRLEVDPEGAKIVQKTKKLRNRVERRDSVFLYA